MGHTCSLRKVTESSTCDAVFRWEKTWSGLGVAAWVLWVRFKAGSFEKVSHGGRVLRDNSAMVAEREALRMGIDRLAVLMPTKVSLFDFEIENSGRPVQYKLDAQSLRSTKGNVIDARRAVPNRLQIRSNPNFDDENDDHHRYRWPFWIKLPYFRERHALKQQTSGCAANRDFGAQDQQSSGRFCSFTISGVSPTLDCPGDVSDNSGHGPFSEN